MIIGIGMDLVEVERIKNAIEKYGDRFKNRIYTEREIEYSEQFGDNKYLHYAARFAAKEAFSKAIGTGITKGFKFKEVGVANEKNGKPYLVLEGDLSEKWGDYASLISLSHTDSNAAAFVVLEKQVGFKQ